MGRKNKLQKFAELQQLDNVYENFSVKQPHLIRRGNEEVKMKGNWSGKHFGNNNPVTLELGCGKGEYTVALARKFTDRNFIGVDIKGARMWKGATIADREGITNAAFLRTRIECIDAFFAKNEVTEIWITFPDPFPKDSKVNRRLTAPIFLEKYRKFLRSGGNVHLKTDDDGLYYFTLGVVADDVRCTLLHHSPDIHSAPFDQPSLGIMTFYEKQHLEAERTIKYVRFTIN